MQTKNGFSLSLLDKSHMDLKNNDGAMQVTGEGSTQLSPCTVGMGVAGLGA